MSTMTQKEQSEKRIVEIESQLKKMDENNVPLNDPERIKLICAINFHFDNIYLP